MRTDRKIIDYKDLKKIKSKHAKLNQKIVLTTGCYDILHLGHVIHFNYCKKQGEILVVSVGNDKCVRMLKGPARPINDELLRSRLIAALEIVDYVVLSQEFGKMDHNELVELLRPDVYVVPATDSMLSEKRELIESNGGKLITCHRLPPAHKKGGISTTKIESKLLKEE